jgi:hypothetical protein
LLAPGFGGWRELSLLNSVSAGAGWNPDSNNEYGDSDDRSGSSGEFEDIIDNVQNLNNNSKTRDWRGWSEVFTANEKYTSRLVCILPLFVFPGISHPMNAFIACSIL